MYEIWSLGHKPYEGYTNPQIQSLVERGERLAPPPGCPRPLYSLMINCWHPEHSCRPSFLNLLKTLSRGSSELLAWDGSLEAGLDKTVGAPLEA
ncbi:Ephrin type-A receptor 5, partial [Geodia barretti]